MTKLALILVASTLTLGALSGCGDDEDDGGGSSKFTAAEIAGGACEREAAGTTESDCDYGPYVECQEMACAAQYEMCLGANYKSGDFSGGACEESLICQTSAPDPCTATCEQSAECLNCFLGFLSCAGSCTPPDCATPEGSTPIPAGTIATGGTCEDLADCCAAVPADQTADCNSALEGVMAGGDAACGLLVTTYRLAGECP
jgi:hypothetical protein